MNPDDEIKLDTSFQKVKDDITDLKAINLVLGIGLILLIIFVLVVR